MVSRIDWEGRIGRRLKLRDLHVYFAVVECGSMAKAAARLGVSQPTVSEIIGDLEHTFGVRLLDRIARGVEPTMYGKALLKRGIAAFDELKQSTRDIEFLADPTVGELKIGCAESIAAAVLPKILERFNQQYPRVVIHVDDVPSTALSVVRDRKHDLVVARTVTPVDDEKDFNIETLFDDQMVLATHARNRWASRRKIKLAELIDEPWFLSAPDTWAYGRLAEACQALGLDMPKASFVTVSVHLRNHMLASGRFVTAIPKSIADWCGLKVLPVDLPVRPWPVVMVTLKNRTLSPIVERFLACAREVGKSTPGWRQAPKSISDQYLDCQQPPASPLRQRPLAP
jgi:DNA-binding transcriptional LysR family regulator